MQSSLQKLRLPFTTFLLKLRRIVVNLYYYPPDFVEQENTKVEIRGQWYKYVADTQGMVQLNDQWSNNFARIGKEVRFQKILQFSSRFCSLARNDRKWPRKRV